MQAQLKEVEDASAAEAAAPASRVRKEKETKRVADTCRDMIQYFSGAESEESQDALLDGYMKSRYGKQDSEA